MEPINFEESNRELTKPESMTDEECGSLSVYTDGKRCISKWRLTIYERIKLLFNGYLWVWVFGGSTQPPISIDLEYPFVELENK